MAYLRSLEYFSIEEEWRFFRYLLEYIFPNCRLLYFVAQWHLAYTINVLTGCHNKVTSSVTSCLHYKCSDRMQKDSLNSLSFSLFFPFFPFIVKYAFSNRIYREFGVCQLRKDKGYFVTLIRVVFSKLSSQETK